MTLKKIDYKEYARQMRENAVKNSDGNIICSPELWEQIASIVENTTAAEFAPAVRCKDCVHSLELTLNELSNEVIAIGWKAKVNDKFYGDYVEALATDELFRGNKELTKAFNLILEQAVMTIGAIVNGDEEPDV